MTNLELRDGSGGGHGRIKLDTGLGESRRLGWDFSGIVNLWRYLSEYGCNTNAGPLSLQPHCLGAVGPGGKGLTGISGKSVNLSQNSFILFYFFEMIQ